MEKAWFLAPVEHSRTGKDIMAPMEYTHMIYTGVVLGRIVFRCGNGHCKR